MHTHNCFYFFFGILFVAILIKHFWPGQTASKKINDNDPFYSCRLGPLGFLTLGNAHGNQGMHDQILALKWVQSEIRYFGGNPKNVTIMGESSGAMSCLLHLISPLSQGLFHKIIATSGSPSTPFGHLDRKPHCYGRAFARHLLRKKLKNAVFAPFLAVTSMKPSKQAPTSPLKC